jgi:hypothetical protein
LDLCINDWRKRQANGEVTIVRYADVTGRIECSHCGAN